MLESDLNLEKSKKVSLDKIHEILGKGKWATLEDYLLVNRSSGLEILFNGKLYLIVHKGIGREREIIVPTTEIQIKKYGKVNLVDFKNIDFAVALLWQFHGAPCERESLRSGGERYLRR